MNLHEKYAALVAKKPELAVPLLDCYPWVTQMDRRWTYGPSNIPCDAASALITAHLLERLPDMATLHKEDGMFVVTAMHPKGHMSRIFTTHRYKDAVFALIAFHEEYPS